MSSLVKSQPGLSPSLAETVRQLASRGGGQLEVNASGTVYAQAAVVVGVSQHTIIQRIYKLEQLGLVRITREERQVKALAIADDALAQVAAFEQSQDEKSRRSTDLAARLRKACEVGRPSAALKLDSR